MSEKQQVSSANEAGDAVPERREDSSNGSPDAAVSASDRPREFGGRKGLEPTRYGDWEKNGRCIDF